MQSVIKYFLAYEVPADNLDKMTGRTFGHQTWTPQIIPVLHNMGLSVMYYTKTDPAQLLKGEEFIRRNYGADAENIIRLTDIPVLKDSVKKLMRSGLYETTVPTLSEICSEVSDGHLVLALLDWNKIKQRNRTYSGHIGVITGFDEENIYFHDSGPIYPKPNLRIPKHLFLEAWNSTGTDNDLVVVSGKRL